VGEIRQVRLTVVNQGKGLLHGSLAVVEGITWLRVGSGKENGECVIKTAREQAITIKIDTHGLQAPNRYSAKLTVITNGGIVEVPVRLDVAVHPFAKPPFQGAASPREMAEKMRTQPKPAVPLLENGDIARWFATNGWSYPVLGPSAKGVAAVQQFFEGMGLSKPPPVELGQREVHVSCPDGRPAQGQLTLRTEAKKWVYARVESDTDWLRVTTPHVSGPQQAVITFEVDIRGKPHQEVYQANLKLVANAGQNLTARIVVDVPRVVRKPRPPTVLPFLIGGLAGLLARLLLAVPVDCYARVWATHAGTVSPGSFASWLQSPVSDGQFIRHVVLATWWLGAVLGACWLWRRGDRKSDVLCGGIAGAAAGLVVSATFACILPALDFIPRRLWQELAALLGWSAHAGSPWIWTPAWIAMASLVWSLLGAGAGLVLGWLGQLGRGVLEPVGGLLSWLLQRCGLKWAAGYFAAS
jgi:hypothetical protein